MAVYRPVSYKWPTASYAKASMQVLGLVLVWLVGVAMLPAKTFAPGAASGVVAGIEAARDHAFGDGRGVQVVAASWITTHMTAPLGFGGRVVLLSLDDAGRMRTILPLEGLTEREQVEMITRHEIAHGEYQRERRQQVTPRMSDFWEMVLEESYCDVRAILGMVSKKPDAAERLFMTLAKARNDYAAADMMAIAAGSGDKLGYHITGPALIAAMHRVKGQDLSRMTLQEISSLALQVALDTVLPMAERNKDPLAAAFRVAAYLDTVPRTTTFGVISHASKPDLVIYALASGTTPSYPDLPAEYRSINPGKSIMNNLIPGERPPRTTPHGQPPTGRDGV